MRRNIAWLIVFLFALTLSLPVFAAPFGDVPEDHWAAEAVSQLAAKGLVEGYPDGLYRGDRAASRYEMAMVVSRLLAKVEQMAKHEHEQYVTKQDLALVRKLMNEYKEELDALGVRMTNAEDAIASLEKRVTELERVRVYGEFGSRWISASATYDTDRTAAAAIAQPTASSANLQAGVDHVNLRRKTWALDPFNYRPYVFPRLSTGTSFTTSGTIGVKGKLGKDIDGGAEVSAWTGVGDRNNALRWGNRQPYLSNPFTENSSFTATGNLKDDAFNFRAALDNVWARKGDWKLTLGTYRPERIGEHFLAGAPNLQLLEPGFFYPLWGAQLKGKWTAGEIPMWGEGYFAKLPDRGGTLGTANTYTFGGRVDLNFNDNKGNVGVNWQRVVNTDIDPATANIVMPLGGPTVGGFVPDGRAIPWTTRGNNTLDPLNSLVTPANQEMDMYGVDAKYKFPEFDSKSFKNFMVAGKWSHSNYMPTTAVFTSGATTIHSPEGDGDLWSFTLAAKVFNVDLKGEWLSVDATYDPFLIQSPNPLFTGAALADFRWNQQSPYSGYFNPSYTGADNSGYYFVHNAMQYPQNRDGYRVSASWDFDLWKSKGTLYSSWMDFNQKHATNEFFTGIGTIEPHFTLNSTTTTTVDSAGLLHTGTNVKGNLQNWHNGLRYDIVLPWTDNRLTWELWHWFSHQRRATQDVNNVFVQWNRWGTKFSYPFSKKLSAYAGYATESRTATVNSRTVTTKWDQAPNWLAGVYYNLTDKATWYLEGVTFRKQKDANNLTTLTLGENGNTFSYNGVFIHSGFNMKF